MLKYLFIGFLFVIFSCENSNSNTTKGVYSNQQNAPAFPFTSARIEKFKKLQHNELGIPLLNYNGKSEVYPITYTQSALFFYNNYIETNNIDSKERFLKIADFIKKEAVIVDNYAVLRYNFPVENYNLKLPAASSMSQSFGMAVLIQAYSITNDQTYLELAEKFLNSFDKTLNEGGVLNYWDNLPFYEEYADPNSHVLNGFIFSLAGLYYAYKTTGNEQAKKYFDRGVQTLKHKIREYDAIFTSYYNKIKTSENVSAYASAINEDPDHYHELVIYQLLTLYLWTGEPEFKEYAHKFLQQDTGWVTNFYDFSKYISIESSFTSEPKEYGLNHLDNELWSWGNYWSTYKFPTELILEFDESRKDIFAATFYAINEESLPDKYDIYIYEENNWVKSFSSEAIIKIDKKYYKTGNYETYIETHFFPKKLQSQKLKIVFNSSKKGNLITLREINIHFNREKELNYILKEIKNRQPSHW